MPNPVDPATLSPEDQAFIKNFHGGALPEGHPLAAAPDAKPSEGLGAKIGRVYREDIAAPLTKGVAKGIAGLDPIHYPAGFTPAEKLPPFAKEVAEYVVPQTATSAALSAASYALPEVGIARKVGEAAGPVARALGTRMGNIAAQTGIGAVAGGLSGEGTGQGALTGLASSAPAQAVGALTGVVGRHLGENAVVRDTTRKFGKALSDTIPWVGKLEKGSDFADAFIHGGAVEKAGNQLAQTKTGLGRATMGVGFDVPVPTAQGITSQRMSFADADKLISDLQKGLGFTVQGAEKSGATPREARALAYQIRDRLAEQLDKHQKGLGELYLHDRRQFDAAKTLTDMFDKRDLIGPNGIHQPKLIDRMNEYSPDLQRSLGQGTSKRLLEVLRRGFIGEGKDIESKAGHGQFNMHLGFIPSYHRSGGVGFDPIGKVPDYMHPTGRTMEAAISNAIGKARAPEKGEGVKSLEKSRADAIAPTPSAAARATDVMKDLSKDKSPDVSHDLNRGRLSLEEVNKILKTGSKTDAMAMLDEVPLSEAMDSLEVAGPDERRMLVPLVQQKMMQQFKGGNFNKTLAANLAKRFQAVQKGATQVA